MWDAVELPVDYNPFTTLNLEEGVCAHVCVCGIYCQKALATAGRSSPCQQRSHSLPEMVTTTRSC